MLIDPGLLRTPLILEAVSSIPDGAGGFVEDWQEIAALMGHVEPLRSSSRWSGEQRVESSTHRVTMRFRTGVEAEMRLRRNGRIFLIETVHDPDETARYLICLCRETRA